MEYVDLKKIDVSLLLELMNENFENARYIALRLEGYNDEKISVSEKNGSEIAKEVAEAPEVMKLRMDTLKKVLQFEDPTIFCRFSEQTRNKKEIYSIALKRMPELKVYVTYRIGVMNEASGLTTQVNNLVDYFDSRYTIVAAGTGIDQEGIITGNIEYDQETYNDEESVI